MIETVLRNLVSNAIKFTRENGSILIEVSDIDNGMVEFSVQDSGIGMDKDKLSKLFRIDTYHSTPGTNNEKGTGLGLILCKELVQMNGGAISAESEPDKGTKFSFWLPVKKTNR
jgi:signal transduction histidine kinase